MPKPILTIKNLTKTYGQNVIFQHLDLTVNEGDTIVIIGPSGTGKSTLLRCVNLLTRPNEGQIWLDDLEITAKGTDEDKVRQHIGMVFQNFLLFNHLTALGNVKLGLTRVKHMSDEAATEKAMRELSRVGLADRANHYPGQLSGGQQQRVGIARALAVGPRLLLMDEPLAALDVQRKREILPYLDRLHDALEIPVLYVSHASDEVARLADHLVVLQAGQALASGPLAETLARLELPIRLGEDAGAVLEATVAEQDPAWHLVRLDFAGGSLWTRDPGLPLGRRVRVRVLARDVSLAETPSVSSIQNCLRGTVEALGDEDHPALALVRVRVGDSVLLARLTRRSAAALHIAPGRAVWVQVKSVALLE